LSDGTNDLALADLDALRPAPLDPGVWDSNLRALRACDPALADRLAAARIPGEWTPALALDDSPTWRLERPGEPARWLAGAAAPRTRARALLAQAQPTALNWALPTIGCGAELTELLDRLSRRQAVFVFEHEASQLGAVLRRIDLSDALRAGRCRLAPPGAETERFLALLAERPGLLPPGRLLQVPDVSEERMAEVRAACERISREIGAARRTRLEQRGRAPALPSEPVDGARLALLAPRPDRTALRAARSLEEAAQRLGWPCLSWLADTPEQAGALPFIEAAVEFQPTLSIVLGPGGESVPVELLGRHCQFVPDANAFRETDALAGAIALPASPAVREMLRNRGQAFSRVIEFYWAAPLERPARVAAGGPVCVVADRADLRAEAVGLTQPTHRRLWDHVGKLAGQLRSRPNSLGAEMLLKRAERETGFALRDAQLRRQALRAIDWRVVPTLAAEGARERLIEHGFEVRVVGRGWPQGVDAVANVVEVSDGAPLAAVFPTRPDPLSEPLLSAVAAGCPVFIQRSPLGGVNAGLGGVLREPEHLVAFDSDRELTTGLRSLAQGAGAQKRALRAADHLRAHHTHAARLRELRSALATTGAQT